MELLYFILSAFGITQILVYGSIFDRIRPSKEIAAGFFHCPMCVGFWVGVFLLGINNYTELFTYSYSFINALLLGSLSAGTSYFVSSILDDFGLKIKKFHEEVIENETT